MMPSAYNFLLMGAFFYDFKCNGLDKIYEVN